MKTARQYREAMNELEVNLEPKNKDYFTDLRVYMELSSIATDERAMTEQLYQMNIDFLDAQEEGISAEVFFGNDPKTMADELLKQLPKMTITNALKKVGLIALVLWGIRLFGDFGQPQQIIINPLIYLFDLLIGFGIVSLFLEYIRRSVYQKKFLFTNKILSNTVAILIFVLFILATLTAEWFIPENWAFVVPYPLDIYLTSSLFLISTIVIFLTKLKPFYSISWALFIFVIIGVYERLTYVGFIPETHDSIFFKIAAVVIGFIGYFWISRKTETAK